MIVSKHDIRTAASTKILGIKVDLISQQEIVEAVSCLISAREHAIIANHNLHSFYLFYHDEELREYFRQARLTHVDGMGLVLLGRALGNPKIGRQHRSTYVDLGLHLFARAETRGWKVFYLGSRKDVEEKAASWLLERYPHLRLRLAHGYFNAALGSTDNCNLVSEINAYKPDLLLVGMGMPRQEHWVLENFDRLEVRTVMCTGAMMDYYVGAIRTAPRWLGLIGLEWLARLIAEPQRLWRRYLLEPWYLLALALRSWPRFGDKG